MQAHNKVKNWIIKLITAMVTVVTANLLFAGIFQTLHVKFWGYEIGLVMSFSISLIVMIGIFNIPCNPVVGVLLTVILIAISFLGYKWCFDSAEKTVHIEDTKEFLVMSKKPIYFTLNDYKYNASCIGHAHTEHKSKKGRANYYVTSIVYYAVAPLYTDSITEEAKAWIATKYSTKPGSGAYNQFTLKPNKVIALKLLNEDLHYYRDALKDSYHNNKHAHPIFIAPI